MIARILTTTACNASCPYCYERGTPITTMSRDTAKQTAIFIAKQAIQSEEGIFFEWFGGEPTLNVDAIDTISSELRNMGERYDSSIVTNGLLMGSRITAERLSLWRLRRAQITLDGPETIHESIKGFSPGAYAQIVRNILSLAEQRVHILLRLNYSGDKQAFSQLIDYLQSEFSDFDRVSAYVNPIYFRGKEYSVNVMQEVMQLNRRLVDSGLASEKSLFGLRERKSRCFMMKTDSFTIAPDGRLFNCSHNMTDEQCVGSIWSYSSDHPSRRAFLFAALSEECKVCAMLPYCGGGCRIAEMGLADMVQCHPYKAVFSELFLR